MSETEWGKEMKVVCSNCRKPNEVPEPLPKRGTYQCGHCKKPLPLGNELTQRKARCDNLSEQAFKIARELGRQASGKPPVNYNKRVFRKDGMYDWAKLLGGFEFSDSLIQITGFAVDAGRTMNDGSNWTNHYYFVEIFSRGKQVLTTWHPLKKSYLPGDWEKYLEELVVRTQKHRAEREREERKVAKEDEMGRFGL